MKRRTTARANACIIDVMNSMQLAPALGVLRDTVSTHGASLHPSLRREIGQLCLEVLDSVVQDLSESSDPREVLQGATLVENQYRAALRSQLRVTAAAEATGAHTLSTAEYNHLQQGTTTWQHPAERCAGRTAHKNTAAVLAAWLNLNIHEATSRVDDTHRVLARRTMAGTAATARFEKLSALFLDPARDPRPARDAARRLEKFEPEDQILAGTALPPRAAGPDGTSLEEHAVRLLRGHDRETAAKRLGEMCTAYRDATSEQAAAPEEFFRKLRTVGGLDIYQFGVMGENSETMRSAVVHMDNPNTLAGRAARASTDPASAGDAAVHPQQAAPAPEPDERPTPNPEHAVPPTPSWLETTEPPPAWAIDPAETPEAGTSNITPAPAQTPNPAPKSPERTRKSRMSGKSGGHRAESMSDSASDAPPRTIDATPAPGAPQPSVSKRRLNAFMALIKQRTTGAASTAQVVPTINVYMQLSELMDLANAHGLTTHGVNIGPAELRRMLCEANVIPHVLGGKGQILDQGRARRTFTRVQRQSMLARDRGCIYPGCTYSPELCEAHHWARGGWAGGCPTNVADGAMKCPIHHDDYHAGKFKIVEIDGLPYVLLPEYLDPTQTPRRNRYWFADDELLPGDAGAAPRPASPPLPPSSPGQTPLPEFISPPDDAPSPDSGSKTPPPPEPGHAKLPPDSTNHPPEPADHPPDPAKHPPDSTNHPPDHSDRPPLADTG